MGAIDPQTFGAVLPEQFGKYSLLGHLATGGMAEVWLARQLGLQGFEKIVVIKRARPELSDADTTQFFLDEARLVATLEHPNIAQVYEIGFVSGSYFFVMEYIDGADLRRLIETAIAKKYPVTLGDALYIITHVCTALHYAHEKHDLEGRPLQIIHRDVSPSNVLISHDGAVKVCDFGIAKAHNRRSEDTQSGVLKGKFSYMSPEQCQSKPVDRRSDVFSIGILLYELSTLTKLFRGGSDFALLQKIVDGEFSPPSARVPGYPPELEAIVMKALATDPDQRYQTAQDLQLDLEAFAREHKLGMSSIGVSRLMSSLFDKRNEAWIRAQRAHSDHFILAGAAPGTPGTMDTPMPTASSSGNLPAFLAVGSAPSAPSGSAATDPTAVLDSQRMPMIGRAGSSPGSTPGSAVSSRRFAQMTESQAQLMAMAPPRRSGALWLVGAIAAGVIAAGISVADQFVTSAGERAAASALTADAERISSVFDAAARSAHGRADGIATTPMLRTAINTDAATLADLVTSEMIFTPGPGESLEVFRVTGGKPENMLRLPKAALPLPELKGRDTKLRIDGDGATIIASATISGYQSNLAGGVRVASPVDLAAVRRALDEHAVRASLTGLGHDLVLVAGPAASPGAPPLGPVVSLAVPPGGEWNAGNATLVAVPKRAAGLPWAVPVRNASAGFGGLLLLGFIVALVRRPRA